MELIFDTGSGPALRSIVAILGREGRGEEMPAAMTGSARADGKSAGGFLG